MGPRWVLSAGGLSEGGGAVFVSQPSAVVSSSLAFDSHWLANIDPLQPSSQRLATSNLAYIVITPQPSVLRKGGNLLLRRFLAVSTLLVLNAGLQEQLGNSASEPSSSAAGTPDTYLPVCTPLKWIPSHHGM